jgi:beta-phosphoglucomutase-like phosphatase (HAD superfamily)
MAKFDFYDVDGTILKNSETIAMDRAAKTLSQAAAHPALGYEHFVVQSGKSVHLMMMDAHKEHGTTFGHKTIEAAIAVIEPHNHQLTLAALTKDARVADDFVAFIEARKAQGFTPIAVTGSRLDRVAAGMKAAGIKRYFPDENIFSAPNRIGEHLSKPQPYIYLVAAHAVGALQVDYTGLQKPERLLLEGLLADPRAFENSNDVRKFTGISAELLTTRTSFPAGTMTAEDSGSGAESAGKAGIPIVFGYLGGTHVKGKEESHGQMLRQRGGSAVVLVPSWQAAADYLANRQPEPTRQAGGVRAVHGNVPKRT